jgi:hypothetical protein
MEKTVLKNIRLPKTLLSLVTKCALDESARSGVPVSANAFIVRAIRFSVEDFLNAFKASKSCEMNLGTRNHSRTNIQDS